MRSKTKSPGRAKIKARSHSLLLPYQAKSAADTSRLKIAEKSRQIGWTWATAYALVCRKSLHSAACDAWVSSRDELQARLFIEDCQSFADLFPLTAVVSEDELFEAGRRAVSHTIRFANARRIHSVSSNPNAQAGKRGDRILDEFALHEDPRRLYAIAYPGITWGGSLEIFSTHRGSRNFFNQLINEIKHGGNPKGFSLHSVTLQTALEQGLLNKLQSKLPAGDPRLDMDEAAYFDFIRHGCPDDESFHEEFCCQPSDDQTAFLSYDLIAGCEYGVGNDQIWDSGTQEGKFGDGNSELRNSGKNGGSKIWKAGTEERNPGGRIWNSGTQERNREKKAQSLYIGVDVGRDHDLTVIWVLEKVGDVHFTRAVICLDRQSFEAQEQTLYEWLRNPAVKRCCIDQTGLGRQFAERAIKKFGRYRVEGLHFTSAVKEELAYPVLAAFQDKTIRIPSDPVLRADLRSIRKECTASGNIRFSGERTQNGHADRFWALALALHAAKEVNAPQIWAQVIR